MKMYTTIFIHSFIHLQKFYGIFIDGETYIHGVEYSVWYAPVNRFFIYVLGVCRSMLCVHLLFILYLFWLRLFALKTDGLNKCGLLCMYIYMNESIGMVYNLVAFSIECTKHSFTIFVQFYPKSSKNQSNIIWISFRLPYYERNFIQQTASMCVCVCVYRRDTCIHIIAVYYLPSCYTQCDWWMVNW